MALTSETILVQAVGFPLHFVIATFLLIKGKYLKSENSQKEISLEYIDKFRQLTEDKDFDFHLIIEWQ